MTDQTEETEKAYYFLDSTGKCHAYSSTKKPVVPTTWVQVDAPPPAPEYFAPLYPVDFKLGMLSLNIFPEQVDTAIEQVPEPDRTIAKIYWTSAQMFERDDPLIEQIALLLGKTPADIDGAWRYAMSLREYYA